MKKNKDFILPQRQSQYAIIFIILKSFRSLLSQLWPLAIAFFLGRSRTSLDTYELVIAAVGLFGIIPAIIAFYKFYFHVSEEELVIEKGVLSKTKLNIPFSRIQSVNFKQTLVHRMFNVTEVVIETAGSSEQETQIDALDMETAEALRSYLLARKGGQVSVVGADEEEESMTALSPSSAVLDLSLPQLIKIGLLQNPFRPIGLLSSLFFSAMFYSYTFDIDMGDIFSLLKFWEYSFRQQILGLLFLIVFGLIYSVVMTIVRFYNLGLSRSDDKFEVVQGLFTRKQFTALDNKIQMINWGQNWLEKQAQLFNVKFRQARSGNDIQVSEQVIIPGCSVDQVEEVKKSWLQYVPQFPLIAGVSKHLFYHGAMYITLITLGIASAAAYLKGSIWALSFLGLGLWVLFINWMDWKKKKYGIADDCLYIGGGVFGCKHALLPIHKIQSVALSSNMYQRRRDLVTLKVYTAAGRLEIPYIQKEKATSLLDRLVYGVESSDRSWM